MRIESSNGRTPGVTTGPTLAVAVSFAVLGYFFSSAPRSWLGAIFILVWALCGYVIMWKHSKIAAEVLALLVLGVILAVIFLAGEHWGQGALWMSVPMVIAWVGKMVVRRQVRVNERRRVRLTRHATSGV